ncbi:hypothetical protein GQ55_5G090100 [Panicum hallii var. hallii]|uniref:Uncharacterized protein n=1 Tax=Panicum hallii var. hallii TaxID=1504633 RepID=A0A2T7DEF8_9POAL|nr:hypothetical protein GQ55_5G090100 [Panicum hallii var. hallii]
MDLPDSRSRWFKCIGESRLTLLVFLLFLRLFSAPLPYPPVRLRPLGTSGAQIPGASARDQPVGPLLAVAPPEFCPRVLHHRAHWRRGHRAPRPTPATSLPTAGTSPASTPRHQVRCLLLLSSLPFFF